MNGYEAKVTEVSKQLSAVERIKFKDTTEAISLDLETQLNGEVIIDIDYYGIIDIHNEKAVDNKDYQNYIFVDKNGKKYITGSKSLWSAFRGIADEIESAGENLYPIRVYRMDSKNYNGKQFLTCSLV